MTRGSAVDEDRPARVPAAEPDVEPDVESDETGTGARYRRAARHPRWGWAVATGTLAVVGLIGLIGWQLSGGRHTSGSAKSTGLSGSGSGLSGVPPSGAASRGSGSVTTGGSGISEAAPLSGPSAASGQASSTASGSGQAGSSAPAGNSLPNVVPVLPTKVIKTGSVSLQVPAGGLGSALGDVTRRAVALGGFVSGSSEQTPSDSSPPNATLTLRLPVAGFEGFVAFVQHQGTVVSINTSGQDVTASYVDLQARIAALQDTRTQFEQVLARASTIGDILSVESQISDLQTQLEQLQGQFNVLDNQTSYSTLTVNIAEKPRPGVVVHPKKPASGLEKSWLHARHSFVRGVEAVIGATGGIAVFLLFAGLLLVLARFGWKAVRSRWAN